MCLSTLILSFVATLEIIEGFANAVVCSIYLGVCFPLVLSLSSSLCLCRSNNAIFGFRPAQNCSVCFWVCSSIVWQTQTFKLKTFEFKFDSNESFLGSERSVCIEHHDAIQRLHCSFSNEYSNEAILFVFSFIVLPDNAICRPYSSSTQLVRFAGPPSCNSIPSRRREQRQKQNICQSRSIFGRTHTHTSMHFGKMPSSLHLWHAIDLIVCVRRYVCRCRTALSILIAALLLVDAADIYSARAFFLFVAHTTETYSLAKINNLLMVSADATVHVSSAHSRNVKKLPLIH